MTDELVTYDDVNNAWGGLKLAPITSAAAYPVFGKLVRKFGGRKMRLPRYARPTNRSWSAPKGSDTHWIRQNGLPRLVHDASHAVFRRLHPTFKTHNAAHAALEKAMIDHVLAKGLHLPKVAPAAPSVDQKAAAELARVEALIKRWTTKARRADTALRKLRRKQKNLAARLVKE